MTTPKDTDIREALRRKYSNVPQMKGLTPDLRREWGFAPLCGARATFSGSSKDPSRPLRGERELKRRRLWPWAGWIAASIVIAFFLWPSSPAVVEQPVVAEVEQQPAPEAPKASDYSEYSENSDYSEYSDNSDKSEPSKTTTSIKPKRSHKPLPKEEPLLAQADPLPEEPVISTQAAEPAAEYQSVQTIRVAPDQVVFVVQTADMPMMANMPSVGELRARGQQLLANVHQQIKEASKQF